MSEPNANIVAVLFSRPVVQHFSAGDVKDGPMPGTRDFRARELAFAERSANVSAGVIDRMKRTIEVEDGNFNSVNLDQFGLAGGNLVDGGYFNKFRH
jgi:hypothetical protein